MLWIPLVIGEEGNCDMDISFKRNNDERVEKTYTKNLPILKLLTHQEIEPGDWQGMIEDTPKGVDKLLWCIGCVGMFLSETDDKFDVWCAYCATVTKSAMEACGAEEKEDRLCAIAYGLAARTYDFSAHPARRGMYDTAFLIKASEYECVEDVDFLSMWNLLTVLLELLRLTAMDNMHEMISAMEKMNRIRSRYREAKDKLPKPDGE